MTILQSGAIVVGVILGIVCVFGLGFCGGSIWEIGVSLNEIRRELYDNATNLKALKQMQIDHDNHIATLEKLEKNYNEALLWYSQEADSMFVDSRKE
jgi:hypothetical protein